MSSYRFIERLTGRGPGSLTAKAVTSLVLGLVVVLVLGAGLVLDSMAPQSAAALWIRENMGMAIFSLGALTILGMFFKMAFDGMTVGDHDGRP